MKKIFYALIFYFAFTASVFAQNVLVESLSDIRALDEKVDFSAKILETTEFDNGLILNENSIINGKIISEVEAKRGKRNGYVIISPVSYETDEGEVHLIEEENLEAKVVGYSKKDYKKMALSAGLSVGSHFVKGLGQIFYFSKGILIPDDDKSRIKTAFHNVYENTPFVYAEKGEDVDIEAGDYLVLKFYRADVPKWRFIKRNK